MITPEFWDYELDVLQVNRDLQESILRDIVRRILKADLTVTDTAAWQAEKLQAAGMLYDDLILEVSKAANATEREIREIFADAETEIFNYDDELIIQAGYKPADLKRLSPAMVKTWDAALKKTSTEAKNLTKTTAVTSQNLYIQACDLAHMQIASGAFSYQDAVRNAVKSAARQGVTVVYESGWVSALDAALRRSALTGVSQTAGQLQKMRAEEIGHDIMEITAHMGARPEHAVWQGRLVSLSGKPGYLSTRDIGYGDIRGFKGANCRHEWYMFWPGISTPAYTPEELAQLQNAAVTFNGREMPVYEAVQKQRGYERAVRATKRELVMYDEAIKSGRDMQGAFGQASAKLKRQEEQIKDFCRQTGLPRDRYREQMFAQKTENGIRGFDRSVAQKAVWANKKLTKQTADDIIKPKGNAMYRKSKENAVEPMPKRQLHKIEKAFKRQGGIIQYDPETDKYLEGKKAEAITYDAKTILLKTNAGRASVFEELIHTAQYRQGINDGSYRSRLECEIFAQQKLLRYSKAYKLTELEIQQTKNALDKYQKELREYNRKGGE